jgi:hypothetical protein
MGLVSTSGAGNQTSSRNGAEVPVKSFLANDEDLKKGIFLLDNTRCS